MWVLHFELLTSEYMQKNKCYSIFHRNVYQEWTSKNIIYPSIAINQILYYRRKLAYTRI